MFTFDPVGARKSLQFGGPGGGGKKKKKQTKIAVPVKEGKD